MEHTMRLHTLTRAGGIAALGYLLTVPVSSQVQDSIQLRGASPEAQSQAAETGPLQFEVASIKPNRTGSGQVSIGIQPGGRFQANNVTLRELIRVAYQVQPFQIVGGPSWMTSDRFDVQAKAEGEFPAAPPIPGRPPGVPQRMLQGLLRDRFQFVAHTETRDMPTYDLVLARRDGRTGERLKASDLDCAAIAAARGRGGAAPAPPPGAQGGRGGFGGCGMRIGPGALSGNGVDMTFLANSLSQMVQRIVTDKTGLSGNYEFEISFTPDGPQPGPGGPLPGGAVAPPVDPNAPSIYTALQEQLGLRLEGSRAPVSVLVVDKAEPPSPD